MPIAIITGASVGIGRASAARFLDRGFTVYNLSRRSCPLDGVHNLACDLSDPASIAGALDTLVPAVAETDGVALVHNASQMRKDSALDCPDADLRAVLETNVLAVNALNQGLLPALPAGSSVIYVGSTLSEKAVAGAYSYVVSKHLKIATNFAIPFMCVRALRSRI